MMKCWNEIPKRGRLREMTVWPITYQKCVQPGDGDSNCLISRVCHLLFVHSFPCPRNSSLHQQRQRRGPSRQTPTSPGRNARTYRWRSVFVSSQLAHPAPISQHLPLHWRGNVLRHRRLRHLHCSRARRLCSRTTSWFPARRRESHRCDRCRYVCRWIHATRLAADDTQCSLGSALDVSSSSEQGKPLPGCHVDSIDHHLSCSICL